MSLFYKKPIKFDGTKEIKSKIRNQTDNVISRRFKILMGLVIAIGVVLLGKLFITQITRQEYYSSKLDQYNTSIFSADTFRGNIYDRNYNRLVYNKNINCATYYAVKGIKESERELIANFLVENVNVDISSVTEREKKDYLIMKDEKYVKSLLSDEEKKSDTTSLYNYELAHITSDILNEHLTDDDIKYYMILSKLKNCTSGSVVLLEDLSIKEASLIGENSSLLRGIKVTNDWEREYTYGDNFKQVLGKVSTKKQGLPATSKTLLLAKGYNNDSRVGTSGLEQQYETLLSGTPATYSMSYDANGNPIINTISSGQRGQDIRLTIDWELQEELGKEIEAELKAHANEPFNDHIYVILMDPNSGEILAMVGKRLDRKTGKIYDYSAGNYLSSYAIGSTFKANTIYTAYKNNVIDVGQVFVDQPMSIKGTKTKKSWKTFGPVNDIQALAVSSNVYMWNVVIKLAGGTYVPNQSLDLDPSAFGILRKNAGELGLGVKTGLDVPNEALGYQGNAKQAGNLLDFAIGQYDTYTPIQMAQYVTTIANKGVKIQPHLFLDSFKENDEGDKISLLKHQLKILDDVSGYKTAFDRIQQGFRQCVVASNGTGSAVNGYYNPAGKTGTAENYQNSGNTDYPNHAFIGYAPYDDPQMTVACLAERQQKNESCKALSKSAFTKYFDKYGIKNK